MLAYPSVMSGIEVKWKGDAATVRFGAAYSVGAASRDRLEASFREIAARHPRVLKIDTEHGEPGPAFSEVAKSVGFDKLEVLEVDSGQPLSRHRPDPIGVMADGEHHRAEGDRALALAVVAMDAPRLRELRIDGTIDYPSLLEAFGPWVAAHPDLVECSLGGSIAYKAWPKVLASLERHATAWGRLQVFGLPVGEHVTARAFAELRARVPGLVDRGEDGDDDG